MSTYSDFQNQNSSEKLVLAKVNASKRLIGFEVHASSVYRLTNFDFNKILSVEDSGAGLTEVFGLSEVVPGSFYNDRTNKILYLETSGSTNPNGEFIAMSFTNFFSNGPVQAANDLSTGFEVNWLPIIQKTSGFGVTLDNEDQIGFALEGAGSITFVMDREYFDSRFEGFIWENQDVEIYSWTRTLDISEAKIIYKGAVNSKTFGNVVRFTLKDKIEQLRRPFPLSDLSTVSGARIPDGLNTAKKRFVYGRLNGFLPTNIDQNLEGGYELSGTVAVTGGSSTITGTGTLFKTWFSPEDTILINGIEFVIESVTSDTVMDATETFSFNASGVTPFIDPDQPKSFINREWIVAGHACHQPPLTITDSLTSNRFFISSTDDVEVGDQLSIGTGSSAEVVTVSQVLGGGLIKTTEALLAAPATGTAVIRPCVQNLRLNNTKLQYGRDYTVSVSSTETKITLETDAEKNINPIRTLNGTVDFTLSSPTVTGVGTAFESQLRPGQHVRAKGQVAFFQILSIESDTSLTLIEDSTYTDTGGLGQFKGGKNFDAENDNLSCTVLGRTSDNTISGELLKTCGEVVKDILTVGNITGLNASSFDEADDRAPYTLGLAIPTGFADTTSPNVRDVLNNINISVFGSLVQNEDFELEYNILRPNRPTAATKITESEILSGSLKVESKNDRIVEDVKVRYDIKEYDPSFGGGSNSLVTKTSDVGQYLVKTSKDKIVTSVLVKETEAQILANRWSFLLSIATNVIKFKTKLQTARLQVNDVVLIDHEKLFERLGGGKRKYAAISSISKTEGEVTVEADDLGNAFNRVCVITDDDAPDFSDSLDTQKAQNGFITDSYGLIENENYGLNVIW